MGVLTRGKASLFREAGVKISVLQVLLVTSGPGDGQRENKSQKERGRDKRWGEKGQETHMEGARLGLTFFSWASRTVVCKDLLY